MTKVFNKSGEVIAEINASPSSAKYALRIKKRADTLAIKENISNEEARRRVLSELENPIRPSRFRKLSKRKMKKLQERLKARLAARKRKERLQVLNDDKLLKEKSEKIKKKNSRTQIFKEQRQKTAAIARRHPLGNIIGETQVAQYKSPGSSIIWATKRKRKP